MRQLLFKKRAYTAIEQVCAFIESKNRPGSSSKWRYDLVSFVSNKSNLSNIRFPLCNHPKFAAKGFSCLVYKKEWVIAFKYTPTTLTVYRIVNGSRLK